MLADNVFYFSIQCDHDSKNNFNVWISNTNKEKLGLHGSVLQGLF